jgi:hypothetical protein
MVRISIFFMLSHSNSPFSDAKIVWILQYQQAKWKPAWLEALSTEKFFIACSFHEHAKKNEKNICCLDCCTSICPHCVGTHRVHRLLQVRRYVYHDVVRLEDLEKLIDCSGVQVICINYEVIDGSLITVL